MKEHLFIEYVLICSNCNWRNKKNTHTLRSLKVGYHYKGIYDKYLFNDIDVKDYIIRQEFYLSTQSRSK